MVIFVMVVYFIAVFLKITGSFSVVRLISLCNRRIRWNNIAYMFCQVKHLFCLEFS
jgi:hypothetical protein